MAGAVRYLSVCSGIEAASAAWQPLGWAPVAFSEIESLPSAVLAHHYADVPNWGDMERFEEWPDADVDVLVGGTPCQSFSVAGLRKGLADPRGNLALTYLAIAERYRPRWLVWENVPGVLSSDGGRAFGALLGGMEKLGYGWAYRILDAQYFGLAQRRRRVFVVGCLGSWAAPAAVLLEPKSLRGDSAPSREAGERAAPSLAARTRGGGGLGTDAELDGGLIPDSAHALRGEGFDASEDGTGRGTPLVPDVSPALKARDAKGPSSDGDGDGDGDGAPLIPMPFDTTQVTSRENRSRCAPGDNAPSLAQSAQSAQSAQPPAVAFHARQDPDHGDVTHPLDTDGSSIAVAYGIRSDAERSGEAHRESLDAEGRVRKRDAGFNVYPELAPTLDAARPHSVGSVTAVRRLTPRECERLMGFSDDYTLIPYRNGMAKDGTRYKALGNSMAVPVVRWIGERIEAVDELMVELDIEALPWSYSA